MDRFFGNGQSVKLHRHQLFILYLSRNSTWSDEMRQTCRAKWARLFLDRVHLDAVRILVRKRLLADSPSFLALTASLWFGLSALPLAVATQLINYPCFAIATTYEENLEVLKLPGTYYVCHLMMPFATDTSLESRNSSTLCTLYLFFLIFLPALA